MHITHVGGEGLLIINFSDLWEEKAVSFFTGLDDGRQWGDRLVQLSVEGFRTGVSDQFVIREFDALDNARVLDSPPGVLAGNFSLIRAL